MDILFFLLSVLAFIAALVYLFFNTRSFKKLFVLKKTTVILVLTFLAAWFLFFPVTLKVFGTINLRYILRAALVSIKNTLQIFSLDADYAAFSLQVNSVIDERFHELYYALGAVYNVFAPIITFSFIISFFNSILGSLKLHLAFFKEVYIFSELTDESVCLAKSCIEHQKKAIVVFCDVFENEDEASYDLSLAAKEMNAICYKKDITHLKFRFVSRFKSINFFVLDDNTTENVNQSVNLIRRFQEIDNANIYLLFDTTISEPIINSAIEPTIRCKVRKKDVIKSCVYREFYHTDIFENAYEIAPNQPKQLTIAIFGFGAHGKELLKAYCWAAQIPDYELHIHVFDADENAFSAFYMECSELMETAGVRCFGDAYYDIRFHTGIKFHSKEMLDTLQSIGKISTAYICFGDDDICLKSAIELRGIFRKEENYEPEIKTIVYSPIYDTLLRKNALKTYNTKERDYHIDIICNIHDLFSFETLVDDAIEYCALAKHLDWYKKSGADSSEIEQKTKDFYKYNYYYNSSIASVLRMKMRYKLNYQNSQKPPRERTEAQKEQIRFAEHLGWNAFMRTEGYSFGKVRSVSGKTHYDLIPFYDLTQAEQDKDDDFDLLAVEHEYREAKKQ